MKQQIITIEELEEKFPPILHYIQKFHITNRKNNLSLAFQAEIDKNLLDNQYYNQVWRNGFCKKLSEFLGKEVIDCGGLGPSWAGYLKVEENSNLAKELSPPLIYFYYSFLSEYYFIMVAEDFIMHEYNFMVPSSLTISPYGKYEKIFMLIESFIKEYFCNAHFLPYIFDSILVNKLKIHYQGKTHCSIHDAFFNKFEMSGLSIDKIHGDIYYNIDEFLNKNNDAYRF